MVFTIPMRQIFKLDTPQFLSPKIPDGIAIAVMLHMDGAVVGRVRWRAK